MNNRIPIMPSSNGHHNPPDLEKKKYFRHLQKRAKSSMFYWGAGVVGSFCVLFLMLLMMFLIFRK